MLIQEFSRLCFTPTFHAWRGARGCEKPSDDIPGFCKIASLDNIRSHGHILTPGRYVGAADIEEDDEPFDEKMMRLTTTLREQTTEAAKLDEAIWENLKRLEYGSK